MAQPTDGTLDEAMAQPTDVTFQELREFNLVGARGSAPNDIVMRLANDIANKVQSRQMANTSVRQLADQLGLTPNQGGFRQRAKKLSGAILTYRQLLEAVQHGELHLHEGLSVDAEPDSTHGSGPSSAFDILVTDAEAPGRVLVGEPSLTPPHSSAFDEAVAKEIAESGEEVDITEKLNRLALEEPPAKDAETRPISEPTVYVATSAADDAPTSWTAQEIVDARAAVDAPGFESYRRQYDVVQDIHSTLGAFWHEYGTRFSSFWQRLTVERRRRLLLCTAPTMPTTSTSGQSINGDDVHGACILMPEMNIEDLTHGFKLLDIFRARTCADQYGADMALVRRQVAAGRLPGHVHGSRFKFYVVNDGEPYTVTQPGGERAPEIVNMLERGQIVESWIWEPMQHRREFMLRTLAAVADEFRTEALKDTTTYATSAPSWLPPGSQAMTQAELEQAWGQYCSLNYSLALTRDKSRKERGPSFDLDERVMDAELLEAVNELKSEGNSLFGRKSYRAASRCYTEAIDQIRICRVREQAMSSSIKLALSTLLCNRVQCSLLLATDQLSIWQESASLLLRGALTDCSSVLDNVLFGSDGVSDIVRKKLEKRQSDAMQLLSSAELRGDESTTGTAATDNLTRPSRGGRRRAQRGLGSTRRNHGSSTAENTDDDPAAHAAAVVRTTELTSTDAFYSVACSVCLETWEGELRDSFAMVLPCGHTLCAECLVNWHATCTAPRPPPRQGTRPPPRQEFACVECRSSIPRRAVQVLLTGVAASVESLQLLAPRLGCDEGMQEQIVHSLLLHHNFDISAVEGSLWEMLQARDIAVVAAQSQEPLQSEQKQQIYEEARQPVRRLEAEVAEARARLKALRVDETGDEWCRERATLDDLMSRLKVARLNAAREIFAQMNADGLGMGTENESVGSECTLDFHGLYAKEAERLATELIDCVLPALRSLVIITGRGLHSAGGRSILRMVIERLLADRSSTVRIEAVDGNPGAIRLRYLAVAVAPVPIASPTPAPGGGEAPTPTSTPALASVPASTSFEASLEAGMPLDALYEAVYAIRVEQRELGPKQIHSRLAQTRADLKCSLSAVKRASERAGIALGNSHRGPATAHPPVVNPRQQAAPPRQSVPSLRKTVADLQMMEKLIREDPLKACSLLNQRATHLGEPPFVVVCGLVVQDNTQKRNSVSKSRKFIDMDPFFVLACYRWSAEKVASTFEDLGVRLPLK